MNENLLSKTTSTNLPDLDEAEARKLTNSVKKSLGFAYDTISELHARRADKALHYENWAQYVQEEFNFSASYGYSLIRAHKITSQIAETTGHRVQLSEKVLRGITPGDVPGIAATVVKQVAAGKTPEAAITEAVEKVKHTRAARTPGDGTTKKNPQAEKPSTEPVSVPENDEQPDDERVSDDVLTDAASGLRDDLAELQALVSTLPVTSLPWTKGWENKTRECPDHESADFMAEHFQHLLTEVRMRLDAAQDAEPDSASA